ncbi:MAG: ethanolamine utilization protein EutJ, partial [Desulfobacteraceae bacterium]|nr:ethanolamine utilization protein EutJ [Desulfobacteraceae bacterium]
LVPATSFERSKIRDALAATSGFAALTGTIRFDAARTPIKNAVHQILKDGRV